MFKLIGIILALMPVFFFLRSIFAGQAKKRSQAVSAFKKQIDYLVWVILFFIGCTVASTAYPCLFEQIASTSVQTFTLASDSQLTAASATITQLQIPNVTNSFLYASATGTIPALGVVHDGK